jgi:hypothetical protein
MIVYDLINHGRRDGNISDAELISVSSSEVLGRTEEVGVKLQEH